MNKLGRIFAELPDDIPDFREACRAIQNPAKLAFKGKETTEIYDILMEQLLQAIQKYDPGYIKGKVQFVMRMNLPGPLGALSRN